jgi:thiol:disulfide interchange protein DsbD
MPNPLIKTFLAVLLLTAQLLTVHRALAEDPFPLSSKSNLLGETTEFLPVEEAYKLKVEAEGQHLAFNWEIQPGYYLYQHSFKLLNPDGSPLDVTPTYEPGKRIYDDYYEKELEVYYQQTHFAIPWHQDQNNLIIESQGCADAGLCYPPRRQTISIRANTSNTAPAEIVITETALQAASNALTTANQPAAIKGDLLLMLAFALLGGVILNLMPCVFPILSIKALSLTTAHLSSHGKHLHGLAYTLGIVLSFMAIAALLMLLRSAGEAIGWGFQLQSPLFVALLVYLFVLMGLSFSGQLTVGTRLMNLGQSATQGQGLTASFMTGLLATLVASPCTAPFMGTALGFALTQPTWIAMSTFAALGLGMALPLLILSWWPGVAEKMPKPGPWMERFKELLAFPLYLSATWLLWVLGRQAGSDTVAAVICGIVLILFSLWLLKLNKTSSANHFMITAVAIISVIIALILPWQTHKNNEHKETVWQPYSAATLQTLRNDGRAVFVNLTADWCITCLANEKLALSSDQFIATLKKNNITYLKGDWTNYNPEITKLLNQHHRSGVPLYLFYPEGPGKPTLLPQILTESIVIHTLSLQN